MSQVVEIKGEGAGAAAESTSPPNSRRRSAGRRAAAVLPPLPQAALAALSAVLLVLAFPDFNFWPLAWVGLVPLLVAANRAELAAHAFLLGWLEGTIFFYASCYWLTYSVINYGGIPAPIAYLLLLPAAATVGIFHGIFAASFNFILRRARTLDWIYVAPFLWAACELARFAITGQLWNAIGYSQAYVPSLIQAARVGGVYAVGFAVVAVNAAFAHLWLGRKAPSAGRARRPLVPAGVIGAVALVVALLAFGAAPTDDVQNSETPAAVVIGVQANVPVRRTAAELRALFERHLRLSETALTDAARRFPPEVPRVVVWSESPMNFEWTRDADFRQAVTEFAKRNRVSVIFNSMEPAPLDGWYNSAVMIDEEGRLLIQYDKIRLLPFGEYVPLPKWLPGSGLVSAVVGDFTPGEKYPLLPAGTARSGVFICFESAFPEVAREFARQDADFLINISNDGYLGPTPVLRQHLANVIFRAAETHRPILRVTNTGLTARIDARGATTADDVTAPFQTAVRVWPVTRAASGQTFYTAYGDSFVYLCVIAAALALIAARHGWLRDRPKFLSQGTD